MKLNHIISNSPITGTKQSKDRVTILFICNLTGIEKLHIILLVDNVSTHALSENTTLTNIVIKYFPLNITSHLQFCDQEIINSFKVRTGIIPEYDKPSNDKNVNCEAYENNIDIQLELKCLKELKEVQVLINKLDFKDSFTAEEFVLYDDFEVTTEMISDDEILKAV
ncbi:tigger transposable element-derived protein 6-like [Rhizophagus irregularis DAOM 181602=DAOM 197198]|nr:tigger transposable element-derived protein 6-like [Rhizophagus irregularis DAOM 181602=DAOM 197198]